MKHLYTVVFHVTGAGEFPFDMLRYDGCFPAQESDSRSLHQSWERRTVKLIARGVRKDWLPTFDRWRSFLWNIEGLSSGYPMTVHPIGE